MNKPRKKVGRPAGFAGGAKNLRLPEDLVQMMVWIARIERRTAAQVVDPLVRREVERRYAELYPVITAIRKAEDAAAVASGLSPAPPLPELPTEEPQR